MGKEDGGVNSENEADGGVKSENAADGGVWERRDSSCAEGVGPFGGIRTETTRERNTHTNRSI